MPYTVVPLRFEHFFCEILIEMLLLPYTDLETTTIVASQSVTAGGSRFFRQFLLSQIIQFVIIDLFIRTILKVPINNYSDLSYSD